MGRDVTYTFRVADAAGHTSTVTHAVTVSDPAVWPTKADTGPAAGTVFTSRAGGVLPVGTYRKVRFTSQVEFSLSGAVLEDCELTAGMLARRNDTGTITLSRCTIVGGGALSSVTGVLLSRCRIVGKSGGDLLHITSDSGRMCTGVTLRDCWIGDAVLSPDDHLDGVQVRGVSGLTIERCTVDVGPWRTTTNGGLNAALFFETANGGNSNITVQGCYLNGGGYILRAGTGGHAGLRIVGNRFGPDGRWGAGLLTQVTPTQCVDNFYLASGQQASGLPIIP